MSLQLTPQRNEGPWRSKTLNLQIESLMLVKDLFHFALVFFWSQHTKHSIQSTVKSYFVISSKQERGVLDGQGQFLTAHYSLLIAHYSLLTAH